MKTIPSELKYLYKRARNVKTIDEAKALIVAAKALHDAGTIRRIDVEKVDAKAHRSLDLAC